MDCKKDVFYDFMKNPKIDWRNIMFLFIKQLFKLIDNKSVTDNNSVKNPKFFIIDDSILEKSGKTIEKTGKVYDHCLHTYRLLIAQLYYFLCIYTTTSQLWFEYAGFDIKVFRKLYGKIPRTGYSRKLKIQKIYQRPFQKILCRSCCIGL